MSQLLEDTGDSVNGVNAVKIGSQGKEEPICLQILGPIPFDLSEVSNIMNHLQPSSKYQLLNNNKSRIFVSKAETLSNLGSAAQLVKHESQSKDQFGVLSKLDDEHYIINYLSDTINIQPSSASHFNSLVYSSDIIRRWTTRMPEMKQKKNNLKLSMTPPTEGSPVKSTNLPQDESGETTNDPFDYFLDRYFDNLYLLTTPLTFFTKSTFTRLRTLCSSKEEYESILQQFVIEHEFFDNRHFMATNGLLNSNFLYEKENIYRKSFIQKSLNLIDFDIHSSTNVETNKTLSNVLNNFKVRELHLQILLLLELIFINGRDNAKHFKKSVKKNPLTKKLLVGRRKLTPTFNGSAIADSTPAKPQKLSCNQNLDIYIEKLCIWDVLMGTSSTDNSTPKFLSYIIIPFFNKKCPQSVKHMLKKIKGPSFKSKSSSGLNSKSKSSSSSSSSSSSERTLKRSASISSSLSLSASEIKRPSLSRSSSNLKLEDIQELRTTLSRSNSDLQNLKRTSSFNASHLSKRQVDMSLPVIPSENEATNVKRNSSIFNRVGKKLSTSNNSLTASMTSNTSTNNLASHHASISQVEATPVKTVKYVNPMIQETPKDSATAITTSSPIEYSKTPMVVQSPVVVRSSVRRPGEPLDFNKPEDIPHLTGSPISKGVRRRLFAPSEGSKH